MVIRCETLEDLLRYLLYTSEGQTENETEISVGIIGDEDISDVLSPNLKQKLLQLLKQEDEEAAQ